MKSRGQGRFLPLLISLVLLFLLYPLMGELGLTRFFRVAFMLTLVAAVYSLSARRHTLLIALALAVPAGLGQGVAMTHPGALTLKIAVVLAFLFIGFVTVVMLRAVVAGGKVTGDKIAGAICVYLLLGLAWAMVYALIDLFQPAAFSGPIEPVLSGGQDTAREYGFIYYSFVTLTTLGYGDLSPVSPFARTAAWFQAVTGQLYIAILVARLVALQIMHGFDSPEEN